MHLLGKPHGQFDFAGHEFLHSGIIVPTRHYVKRFHPAPAGKRNGASIPMAEAKGFTHRTDEYSLVQRYSPFMTMLMTLSWRTFIILAAERTRCSLLITCLQLGTYCLLSSETAGGTDSVVANLQLRAQRITRKVEKGAAFLPRLESRGLLPQLVEQCHKAFLYNASSSRLYLLCATRLCGWA